MPRKRAKTSREKIRIAQRRAVVIDYRLQGIAVSRIAKALKVSTSTVIKIIQKSLADMCPREDRVQLLQQELQRLDAMQASIFRSAYEGDLPAIRAVLDIMNHRAKLTGLYPDGKGGEINLNIGGPSTRRDARECGIEVRFIAPTRHPDDDDLPSAEVVPIKPPLKLVEHQPLPIPDPDPNADNHPAAPPRRAPSVTAEPRNAVPVPPEHPEITRDRSKRLPDPPANMPRTEFDLPAKERRPDVLHESLFKPPPKGAA